MPAVKTAARANESRLRKKATEEKLESAGMMRWLLTYADMITLLLALFIIMFAASTMSKVRIQRLVHDISGGFQGPDALNNPPNGGMPGDKTGGNDAQLMREQRQIQQYIKEKHLQDKVTTKLTSKGLVISLFTDKALYDSGSAELRLQTRQILDQVSGALRRNDDEIRVEGYTDNVPIATSQYPTNWELSAARATGVTRYLVENGRLNPARISLAGYGEYRPTGDNASEDKRQRNRRVDVVILNARVTQAIQDASRDESTFGNVPDKTNSAKNTQTAKGK